MAWIERGGAIALLRQCELTGVARASVYRRTIERERDEEDLLLCRLIDEEYTRRPFYGSRRMVVYLGRLGHVVNRKRVQRLMRTIGLAGMAPGPNTSSKHPQHKVSVSAARRGRGETKCGVECGCDIHPPGAWLCLPGGSDRLVLAARTVVADIEQHGCVILRGLSGRCVASARQAEG